MQQDPAIFSQMDDQYDFQTIIFSHTDITPWAQQFIASILNNPEWTLIYLDERIFILVKTISNPELVDNYQINPDNIQEKLLLILKSNNLRSYVQLKQFFQLIGWQDTINYLNQKIQFMTKNL